MYVILIKELNKLTKNLMYIYIVDCRCTFSSRVAVPATPRQADRDKYLK